MLRERDELHHHGHPQKEWDLAESFGNDDYITIRFFTGHAVYELVLWVDRMDDEGESFPPEFFKPISCSMALNPVDIVSLPPIILLPSDFIATDRYGFIPELIRPVTANILRWVYQQLFPNIE
jgi:hypothetical protein